MIIEYQNIKPEIHDSCFVADSAEVIGRVKLEENSSIWYGCIIRGDENYINIGKNTNIQDGTVVHISREHETLIGDYVTVGHKAILHACEIGDNVLVGMGAIILDGVKIEGDVLIAAGSIVTPGKIIPKGSLVMGSPAKVVRNLSEEEIINLKQSALDYCNYAKKHKI